MRICCSITAPLIKTASTPSYSQDVQWFANQMGLDAFNEENFDNNVQHLIGKLDYLLIDGYKKFLKTSDSSWLEKVSHIRANAIARWNLILTIPI